MDTIFTIKASATTQALVATLRAFILPTVVVVEITDDTVPAGLALIDTFEGKWNGRVIIGTDAKAYAPRAWAWIFSVRPDQIAWHPRDEASLAFILGDDEAPFTPDPDSRMPDWTDWPD